MHRRFKWCTCSSAPALQLQQSRQPRFQFPLRLWLQIPLRLWLQIWPRSTILATSSLATSWYASFIEDVNYSIQFQRRRSVSDTICCITLIVSMGNSNRFLLFNIGSSLSYATSDSTQLHRQRFVSAVQQQRQQLASANNLQPSTARGQH
jgi:hypothetical protein